MAQHPEGPPPVPSDPNKPDPPPLPKRSPKPRKEPGAYEIVTDVAIGPNIRVKDNVFQAVFIAACLVIAITTMFILTGSWLVSLLFGGLAGLVGGALLSGGFLMVYRLFKH